MGLGRVLAWRGDHDVGADECAKSDLSLLTSKPLPNVGHVVVTGNPTDGWTLAEWDADPPPC